LRARLPRALRPSPWIGISDEAAGLNPLKTMTPIIAAQKIAIVLTLAITPMAMLASASVAAQQVADPDNAATWYRLAVEEYRSIRFDQPKRELVWAFEDDPDRPPPPEVRQEIRRYHGALNLFRRATRRQRCDFGSSQAMRQDSPLQSDLRGLAFLIRDEFRLHVLDGNIDAAVDCVRDVLRLGDHMGQAGAYLPSAFGAACVAKADQMTRHALDRGVLGPAEAARLVREIDRLKGDDPLGFRAAASFEARAAIADLQKTYSGDGGVERFRADYGPYFEQSHPDLLEPLASLTPEELDRTWTRTIALNARILAVINNPDLAQANDGLAIIKSEIAQGKHGPFASFTAASMLRVVPDMQRTRKTLDDLRQTLQGIAEGTTDPMSLANAAPWYVRAAVAMEQVDGAAMRAIDAAVAQPDQPPGDELLDVLQREDVRAIVKTLRTASNIERCDFSYIYSSVSLFARHHAGLLACGRLLSADAARALRGQDHAEAAERLFMLYRLSARLAPDQTLGGALAAQRIFDDAERLCAPAMAREAFDSANIAAMARAVREIARSDPFHHQPKLAARRERVQWWFTYLLAGMPPNPATKPPDQCVQQAAAAMERCSDDLLIALQAMTDVLARKVNRQVQPAPSPLGLETIFDLDALQEAADKADLLPQWASQGVLGEVASAGLPLAIVPGGIDRRLREAEASVRECRERFDRALAAGAPQASGKPPEPAGHADHLPTGDPAPARGP